MYKYGYKYRVICWIEFFLLLLLFFLLLLSLKPRCSICFCQFLHLIGLFIFSRYSQRKLLLYFTCVYIYILIRVYVCVCVPTFKDRLYLTDIYAMDLILFLKKNFIRQNVSPHGVWEQCGKISSMYDLTKFFFVLKNKRS